MAQYGQRLLVGQSVSKFGKAGEPAMITKVDRFTADGTYTPATGVTYAVAYIRAGGGGVGTTTSAGGAGGTSSVAFASGTISATGGNAANQNLNFVYNLVQVAGVANSGYGAWRSGHSDPSVNAGGQSIYAGNGAIIVAGGAVTAGVGIAVTVGAGGTAGSTGVAGGSGYVYIEYQVKA